MANTQSAFGFRHIGFLPGFAPDYQLITRAIQSTYSTVIGWGDPVVKSGGSPYIIQAAGGTSGTGATSTSILEGIFQGCNYIPKGGGPPAWSSNWTGAEAADGTAYLLMAPGALFLVAATNTAISSTTLDNNFGFQIGSASTTGAGFSGATLDQSTATTINTWPFKLVQMYAGVGNGSDQTTSYNWVVVTFNNQQFKTLTGVA